MFALSLSVGEGLAPPVEKKQCQWNGSPRTSTPTDKKMRTMIAPIMSVGEGLAPPVEKHSRFPKANEFWQKGFSNGEKYDKIEG